MGEVDVLKTLQLLPGVQSGAEGMSGLYVRGGSPDQNLLLLDGAPVYLPYVTVVYGERNDYRMSAFHYLDLGFNFGDKHGFGLGVYNAYNRKNPFFIYFEDNYDPNNNARQIRAKQMSLFPLLPWINYRFKF